MRKNSLDTKMDETERAAAENASLAAELRDAWAEFQGHLEKARRVHAKADQISRSIEANNNLLRSAGQTKRVTVVPDIRRAVIGDGMRFSDGTVDVVKLSMNGRAIDKVLAGLGSFRVLTGITRRAGRSHVRVA